MNKRLLSLMNKRLLSFVLSIILIVVTSIPSAADTDITADSGSGILEISYAVSNNFFVTIPASVAATMPTVGSGGTFATSIAVRGTLNSNQTMSIKISGSANYTVAEQLFYLKNGNDNTLQYTIEADRDGDGFAPAEYVSVGTDFVTYTADEVHSGAYSCALKFTIVDDIKYGGTYTDRLTFTVSINENQIPPT